MTFPFSDHESRKKFEPNLQAFKYVLNLIY